MIRISPHLIVLILPLILEGCLFSWSGEYEHNIPIQVVDLDELVYHPEFSAPYPEFTTLYNNNYRFDTQADYNRLIYNGYQRRILNHCDTNYVNELDRIAAEHPAELPIDQTQDRIQTCFEEQPRLQRFGKLDTPEIDFSDKTLLGMPVSTDGCKQPDYEATLTKDLNGDYTFNATIIRIGGCAMAVYLDIWIVAPKIPKANTVYIEREFHRRER